MIIIIIITRMMTIIISILLYSLLFSFTFFLSLSWAIQMCFILSSIIFIYTNVSNFESNYIYTIIMFNMLMNWIESSTNNYYYLESINVPIIIWNESNIIIIIWYQTNNIIIILFNLIILLFLQFKNTIKIQL